MGVGSSLDAAPVLPLSSSAWSVRRRTLGGVGVGGGAGGARLNEPGRLRARILVWEKLPRRTTGTPWLISPLSAPPVARYARRPECYVIVYSNCKLRRNQCPD